MFTTDFGTEVTMEKESGQAEERTPFRILFLGDWSGRASSFSQTDLPKFKTFEIDRDNFDETMQRISVKLVLPFDESGEKNLSFEFFEIDDFHPDQIFQKLPIFANLRDIREKLLKADTFNEAAVEVNSWLVNDQTEKSDVKEPEENTVNIESNEDLLDQILSGGNEIIVSAQTQSTQKSELSEFISRSVKPYIVQTDLSEQSKLLLIVDEVISDLMRNILHHPQFQELESAWRGLSFFVRRIETNSNLKIHLLDITKEELSNNLKSSDDLTNTSFFKLIESGISGSFSDNEPWTVIGGNYSFSFDLDDIALLMRMAKISGNVNAPFISYVNLNIAKAFINNELGASSGSGKVENFTDYKLWETLRATSEADFIGLISPRFLARLPYGKQTDPSESFAFEEFLSFEQNSKYLWTNPAFACISMLAQTFSKNGWEISVNFNAEINNIPMYFYQEDQEMKNLPCTELPFNERNCDKLLDEGIMPLVSFRSADKVRLARLQSIANPISLLSGKWE